jgi:hypothetical protein
MRKSSSFGAPSQVDMVEAQDEWVLRPYMNTAKRRHVLSKDESDEETKIGIMLPTKPAAAAAAAPPPRRR